MVITLESTNKIQKKRIKRNFKKPKLRFGDYGLTSKNEGRLELIQITQLKKKVKLLISKKKSEIDLIREKIWYFCRLNYIIQKKPKNSRMGKGKGLIERKCIILKKNFIILEFKGVPLQKLISLVKFLNKILNIKVYLVKRSTLFCPLWSKNTKYFVYHNKYLI